MFANLMSGVYGAARLHTRHHLTLTAHTGQNLNLDTFWRPIQFESGIHEARAREGTRTASEVHTALNPSCVASHNFVSRVSPCGPTHQLRKLCAPCASLPTPLGLLDNFRTLYARRVSVTTRATVSAWQALRCLPDGVTWSASPARPHAF